MARNAESIKIPTTVFSIADFLNVLNPNPKRIRLIMSVEIGFGILNKISIVIATPLTPPVEILQGAWK